MNNNTCEFKSHYYYFLQNYFGLASAFTCDLTAEDKTSYL